jgi:hypothetical protein
MLAEPLPPGVRAGLIQALAAQPGVHAIGAATDPLGRRGVALASDDQAATVTGDWSTPAADQGTYRWRQVIIFDRATGTVLANEEVLTTPGGQYAQEQPGFVIYYQAVRSEGWTNTKPGNPRPCRSRVAETASDTSLAVPVRARRIDEFRASDAAHHNRPPAGGYCLASQVAGFSHAFRVAVTAPGHARARPGSNDPGPGRDSPAGQLVMLANMPGS